MRKAFETELDLKTTMAKLVDLGYLGKEPVLVSIFNLKFILKTEKRKEDVLIWLCINGFLTQAFYPIVSCKFFSLNNKKTILICKEIIPNSLIYNFGIVILPALFSGVLEKSFFSFIVSLALFWGFLVVNYSVFGIIAKKRIYNGILKSISAKETFGFEPDSCLVPDPMLDKLG